MRSDARAVTSSANILVKCPFPNCDSIRAVIEVRSASVVTFRCEECGFEWSADINGLPERVRSQVDG
jgi:hypothetical protein